MPTIFTTASSAEAHLIVHLLERNRIPAEITGEALQGALGELPALGNVRIRVAASDADKARELIAEWENTTPDQRDWACNACSERNPGSFELCWNCGASAVDD